VILEVKNCLGFLNFPVSRARPEKTVVIFIGCNFELVMRLCEKNCVLLAKILKMCRKIHICEVKGSGYVATENNQFLACYEAFQKWLSF